MKHWTPEEEAKLAEMFPLEGHPPTEERIRNRVNTGGPVGEITRSTQAILAKWYELSAKGGYRKVNTRGLPVELTKPGMIRSLAKEVQHLRKENAGLQRKLGNLDKAISEASDILKGK